MHVTTRSNTFSIVENHLGRDMLIFCMLRMISDFSKLILASELRVAAALFGIYTLVVGECLCGGLLYWRAFLKKQRSGRRVVRCFIKSFEIRTGNTNVWCHSHMAF